MTPWPSSRSVRPSCRNSTDADPSPAVAAPPADRRNAWRALGRPGVGVFILGLLVSLAAWWMVRGWETRQQAAAVREQVSVDAQAVAEILRHLVGDVQMLAQFYGAAEAVSADAFARFTRPLLDRHPGLRALEWVPRVRDTERSAFEARTRAEGLADFTITERIGGTLRPAGPRPEYFPVLRVEPLTGNAGAPGLDQGADPLRGAALEQALDTGQPAAGAPLTPARETAGQRHLIIFVPQGPPGVPGETAQTRRERVQGFAVGVLRLGDLMEGVIAQLPPQTIDLVLLDPAIPGDAGVLDVHPAHARPAGAPAPDPATLLRAPLSHEVPLRVAGHTLVLRGAPAPGTTPGPVLSLALPGLGLAISVALAWLVRYRRTVRGRLQESEARFRDLFEHMHDGFAYCRMIYLEDQPRDFLYLAVNPAYGRLTGLRNLVGRRAGEAIRGLSESNPEVLETYGRVARTGKPELFETYVAPLGIWVSVSVYSPARDHFVALLDNITTRKQVEAALSASEERLRLALDAAHMGIFDWNTADNRIVWTREHERLWGFAPGEFDGTYASFAGRVHPDDLPMVDAELARCMAQRDPYGFEFRVVWPDGTVHWVAGRGEFIFAATGRPARMYGTVMDVTERKRAEAALQESEARLRLVIEHAPAALAVFDREMRYIVASHRWLADYGLTGRDLTGLSHYEVFPEITDALKDVHRRALAGESVRAEDDRFERADGSIQWLRWEVCPWHDARDQVGGIAIFSEDITAYKEAELALRAQHGRLEAVFAAIPDVIVEYDAQLRPMRCNAAALRVLGQTTADFTRDQAVGRLNFRPPEGSALPTERLPTSRALQGEVVTGQIFTITTAEGEERVISTYAAPLFDGDRIDGVLALWHDMTERYRAEQALEAERAHLEARVAARTADLQASEAKLRTIYDLVPVGISITDPAGRLIDCNRAAETILGLTRDEHLRRTYDGPDWPLVRPDGTPMPPDEYASVRALREGRAVHEVEMGLVRPDGTTWISVSAMPARHPDYGVVIAYMDITGRRRAAMDLQALTDRLQLATEAGGIGVWEWDIIDDRLWWDQRMYALYGVREQDFTGAYTAWVHGLHPEDVALAQAAIDCALRGEWPFSSEFRVCWPDGRVRHIAAFGKLIRDATGAPRRMIGVNWDITDQKLAVQALAASEAKARAVIDASPVPLALAHETGAVTYLNAAFTETFGYTLADIPTWTDWRLKSTPDPLYRQWILETRRERLAKVRRDGGLFEPLEVRVCCKDGARRTVMARATPLAGEERLNTLYDITALKQAREEAEQAALSKAEFLAHMSHEIRTPMNGIIGLSELALQQPLDPKARDYLEKLNQSGRSLLGLLNDILDHSRLEAGRLSLDLAPFALETLHGTLRTLFAQTAETRGLGFVIETGPDVPRYLLGDALRLRQVLSNLLGNALKFTHRGQVCLRVACLGVEASRARLRWTVQDTGIGMDAATRARLFEPFIQGDASIARRYGGSGLGLYISRNLIRLMGGELGVVSTPGVGSTFTIELRLQVAAAAPPAAVTPPAPGIDLTGTRVLVAEDQAINQQVIGDMLRLLGVRVTLASHGREALERLAEADFDAVLMDVQMPGMDGLTATRRIRQTPAWADLPVIALTAGVTDAERDRMTACGMTDLLPKPVTLETLATTLGRWIGTPNAGTADLAALPEPAREDREPGGGPQETLTLPGFDLRTLVQTAGDRTRVIELLHRFAAAIRDDAQVIAAALAGGDGAQAGQRLHRLKGTAANLGAIDLQAAAERLETVLRDGQDPAPALALLTDAHDRALARIASLPPTPALDRTGSAAGDGAAVRRVLTEIHALLDKGLLVPPDLPAELQAALPADDQALYHTLQGHLTRFDYPAAGRLLEPLLSAPPTPGIRP